MERRKAFCAIPTRRGILLTTAALAGLALLPRNARAQTYPSKPVKIVVGYSAGGATDLSARLVATILSRKLGQPVTVENRPGASGGLATELVAASPADGYTLLVASTPPIVVNPHTYKNMRVDPLRSLEHIAMVGDGNYVLGVNAALGVTSLAELVDLSKNTQGGLRFGTTGVGGGPHLVAESIRLKTGAALKAVHYQGAAQVLPDLLANQVQMLVTPFSTLAPHVQAGNVRVVLTFNDQRDTMAPDAPTAGEAGYPDLDKCKTWVSLHAPKGTPAEIVEAIHAVVAEGLVQKEYADKMAGLGFPYIANTPAQFKARLEEEYRVWGEIARTAGVTVD